MGTYFFAFRAENVVSAWDALVDASTKIYNKLPAASKPAFFQTVQHPVVASATLGKMWISQGFNQIRAQQARLSTNVMAQQVQDLFNTDYDLENEYHTMLDGESMWSIIVNRCLFILLRQMEPVSGPPFFFIWTLIYLQHDGSNSRYVLLLATTDDELVCGSTFFCFKNDIDD